MCILLYSGPNEINGHQQVHTFSALHRFGLAEMLQIFISIPLVTSVLIVCADTVNIKHVQRYLLGDMGVKLLQNKGFL